MAANSKSLVVVKVLVKQELEDDNVEGRDRLEVKEEIEDCNDDANTNNAPRRDLNASQGCEAEADAKTNKRSTETKTISADQLRRRKRIAAMTPEQLQAFREKNRLRSKRRREKIKQNSENRQNTNFKELSTKTPETVEEFREKERERVKRRRLARTLKETEEERAARNMRRRNKKLTEDERKARNLRNYIKYQMLSEEEKEKRRELRRFNAYCSRHTKLSQMTEEEQIAWRKEKTEYARIWRQNLQGEKLEKFKEYHRKRITERLTKLWHTDPVFREKFKARQRQSVANETPEKRQKRLRRYKIEQAVRKLKKQLEGDGIPQEDIKDKCMELKKKMEAEPLPPLETLSEYKPRYKKAATTPCLPVAEQESEVCKPRRRPGRPPKFPQHNPTPDPPVQVDNTLKEQIVDSNGLSTSNSLLHDEVEEAEFQDYCDNFDYSNSNFDVIDPDHDYGSLHIQFSNFERTVSSSSVITETNSSSEPSKIVSDFSNVLEAEGPVPVKLDKNPCGVLSKGSKTLMEFTLKKRQLSQSSNADQPIESTTSTISPNASTPTNSKITLSTSKTFRSSAPEAVHPPLSQSISVFASSSSLSFQIEFDMKCPHCTSTYSQRSDLTAHISSEHPKKCWKCPKCGMVMLNPSELQEHFKAMHSSTSSKPTPLESSVKTPTTRNDPSPVKQTVTEVTPSVPLKPAAKSTPTAVTFTTTTQSGNKCRKKTFNCIKCENLEAFEAQEYLNNHVKLNHPDSYFPCSTCGILRYSESSLTIHGSLCRGKILPKLFTDKPKRRKRQVRRDELKMEI